MKSVVSLRMRSCIFHPTKLAISWSGHVHCHIENIGEISVLVGKCKYCDKLELNDHNYESTCNGCYGLMDGLR